jgi:serine/threonine protein kinase
MTTLTSAQLTVLKQSQYRILGQVGQGQFAQVFCGVDRQSGQLVALKQLTQSRFSSALFLRELALLTKLRHPNIIRFQSLAYTAKTRYVVTDYCAGGTLRDLMEDAFPLKLTQCVGFVVDILRGLEYAHARGIIHCDLKPENILLAPTATGWTARIADFGVAQWQELGAERGMESSHIGSPAYKSPEAHYGSYTPVSDLYAVGVLLFELIVGHRPFSGRPGDLMNAHMTQTAELPENIPFALRSLLTTALQKLPQRRFESASAMLKALLMALDILQATEPDRLALGRFPTETPQTPMPIAPIAKTIDCYSEWGDINHLLLFNQRNGLAILPSQNPEMQIWRLFNRRGYFIDYCELPAIGGPLSHTEDYQVRGWLINDPSIELVVDLKPLRVRRVQRDS